MTVFNQKLYFDVILIRNKISRYPMVWWHTTQWRIQGGGAHPHLATKFFSISCSFWGTFNKFLSQRPHLRVGAPLWENPGSTTATFVLPKFPQSRRILKKFKSAKVGGGGGGDEEAFYRITPHFLVLTMCTSFLSLDKISSFNFFLKFRLSKDR